MARAQGSRAMARKLGFRSIRSNPITHVMWFVADLIGDLLRKIFGKITSRDLKAERENLKEDLAEGKETLSSINEEQYKADQKLQMTREEAERAEKAESARRHSELLSAANRIQAGQAGDADRVEPDQPSQNQKHEAAPGDGQHETYDCSEYEVKVPAVPLAALSASGDAQEGLAAFIQQSSSADSAELAINSDASIREAAAYAERLQEGDHPEMGEDERAESLVRVMAYLEVVAEARRAGGHSVTGYDDLNRRVTAKLDDFSEEMANEPSSEAVAGHVAERIGAASSELGVVPSPKSPARDDKASEKATGGPGHGRNLTGPGG